jgi:hypothetical protein
MRWWITKAVAILVVLPFAFISLLISLLILSPILLIAVLIGATVWQSYVDGPVVRFDVVEHNVKMALKFRHSCPGVERDYRCLEFRSSNGNTVYFRMLDDWGPGLPIAIYDNDGKIRIVDCTGYFDVDVKTDRASGLKLADLTGRERHLVTLASGGSDGQHLRRVELMPISALATSCGG